MNISSNGKLLLAAARELTLKWQDTKNYWQDAKAHEFEQRYINELIGAVDRAAPVFDSLNKMIEKVRTDCE